MFFECPSKPIPVLKMMITSSKIKILSVCLSVFLMTIFFVPETRAQTEDCGGLGEPKCEFSEAKLKAANKPGCPAGTFLDLNKCWSCDSGYSRSFSRVDADDACHTGLLGSKRRANDHGRPAKACEAGYTHDPLLNKCFKCPVNHNRTLMPVDEEEACSIRADLTCDEGLVLDPFAKECTSPIAAEVEEAARDASWILMEDVVGTNNLAWASEGIIANSAGRDQIETYQKASNMPEYDEAAEETEAGLRTLTIGVLAQAGVVAMGSLESGIAIDLRGEDPVRGYAAGTWGFTAGFDATTAITVGKWFSSNSNLDTDAHGYTFSLADLALMNEEELAGMKARYDQKKALEEAFKTLVRKGANIKPVGSAAVTIWFENASGGIGELLGFTTTVGVGVGLSLESGYTKRGTLN